SAESLPAAPSQDVIARELTAELVVADVARIETARSRHIRDTIGVIDLVRGPAGGLGPVGATATRNQLASAHAQASCRTTTGRSSPAATRSPPRPLRRSGRRALARPPGGTGSDSC